MRWHSQGRGWWGQLVSEDIGQACRLTRGNELPDSEHRLGLLLQMRKLLYFFISLKKEDNDGYRPRCLDSLSAKKIPHLLFMEMLLESCLGDEEGSGRCTLCFQARAGVQHNQYFLGPQFWDTQSSQYRHTFPSLLVEGSWAQVTELQQPGPSRERGPGQPELRAAGMCLKGDAPRQPITTISGCCSRRKAPQRKCPIKAIVRQVPNS